MPTLDEIRTVTIQAKTDGVTQSTDQVNKLADSQSKLADSSAKATVVTDNQTRSHLSAQTALDRLRRQIDTNFASQQSMERGQATLTRAEQQGLITGALHADLLGKLKEKYEVLTPAETKFAEAASVVESRMVGMSASVGLVGEVLGVIGAGGLAAAASFGALAVAAVKFTESANRLGDWARQLQDASTTIGLTTVQLQALDAAGESVGVSVETNNAAFERFAVNLGALKGGTGALYTELEKVNPSLVNQLSVTKSNADAWNLLAQAYAHADAQQQALIAHAAFGRGGASVGRVLTATDQAGGLGGLADQNSANAFTQEQIALWARLRSEIATDSAEASRNIASIFTGPVLEAEAKFEKGWLNISQGLRDFQPGEGWHLFVQQLAVAAGRVPFLAPLVFGAQLYGSAASKPAGAPTMPGGGKSFSASPFSAAPFSVGDQQDASLGVQVARQKELITVLGSAATAYDHLKLKLLELDVVQQDHTKGITDEEIARGRAAASLDAQIAVESKRNGLLGDLASATALAKQKDDELNRARIDGIKFSTAEIQAMKERNQLLAESSRLENQLVFARQQLFKTSADQSVDATLRAAGIPSASERAAAIRDYVRMTDALSQANSIGGTFASGFLTDISHGVNAIDALRSALTRVADTLIDMGARQLFNSALGGLGSALGLGSPLSLAPGNPGGSAGILAAIHHGGGMAGVDSVPGRYVHPAYFDHAPRYHNGIDYAGGEMPAIVKRGEEIGWPGQLAAKYGGGGSGSVTLHAPIVVNLPAGATKTDQAQADLVAATIKRELIGTIRGELADQMRQGGILRR